MAVYVGPSTYRFGTMIMCHMVADTIDELHAMAGKIGVRRRWFQNKPGYLHYDVSKGKRRQAVYHGAIETDERRILEVAKACR